MSPAGQGKATLVGQLLSTQSLQQCVQAGGSYTLTLTPCDILSEHQIFMFRAWR